MVLIIYISTLCTNEKFTVLRGSNLVGLAFSLALLINIPTALAGGNFHSLMGAALMFESNQFSAIVFLISYLLMALICVVKLVKFEAGPLTKRL